MIRSNPTISELKDVVRIPNYSEPYAQFIIRPISIYFTWLFVRTPLTANHVTILQEIIGVGGVICLGLGSVNWAVAGVMLLQLGFILDCTDGEVARWKGQQSIDGVFLDLIGHVIIIPMYMFSLGFGLWIRTGFIEMIIFGFLSSLFVLKLGRLVLLDVVDTLIIQFDSPQYNFDHIMGKLNEEVENIPMGSTGGIGKTSTFQGLFRYPTSMNIITVGVLLDFFLQGTNVMGRLIPFTYFLVVFFGIMLTIGRIVRISSIYRRGLTEIRLLQILKSAKDLTERSKNYDPGSS